MSLVKERLEAWDFIINKDPYYTGSGKHPVSKRIQEEGEKVILKWGEVDHDEFLKRASQCYLDEPEKPAGWTFIILLLHTIAHRCRKTDHTKGRKDVDNLRRLLGVLKD